MSTGIKIIIVLAASLIIWLISKAHANKKELAAAERERKQRELEMLHAQYDEHLERAILNLLLSGDDQYPNGEERRAFYVALTRAKEKFVFLADKSKRSKFLREIHEENAAQEREAIRCRKCEAEMRFIKNVKSKFSGLNQLFGCENYKYGCGYTEFV